MHKVQARKSGGLNRMTKWNTRKETGGFPSKYQGRCRLCRGSIHIGDYIELTQESGWAHANCNKPTDDNAKKNIIRGYVPRFARENRGNREISADSRRFLQYRDRDSAQIYYKLDKPISTGKKFAQRRSW